MAKDYGESVKYKRMKERQMAVSVEKILEKKKKMINDARGHILPLINTKQNSPKRVSQRRPEMSYILVLMTIGLK